MRHIIHAILMLAFCSGTANAQKPSAASVLDGFVRATGGSAAYARLKSIAMKGTVNIKAQGVSGTMKAFMQAPDRFYAEQTVNGIGTLQMGFDGKTGWSKDPFFGLRDIEGPELEMNKLLSTFNGPVEWRKLYRKAEYAGVKTIDGRRCHVIRLVPRLSKPITAYYEAKNNLLYRLDLTMESPQGTMPTQVVMRDYRPVGGVRMPFHMTQTAAGISQIEIRVTSAQANVPVDAKLFRKPEK